MSGRQAKDHDALEWWRAARFGMFIHWGLYALPGGRWEGKTYPGIAEWIMCWARVPAAEYERLAAGFNPTRFDARAWVRLAKEAGQKYIVITAKHHDGFALFDSPCSDYDIVDATPFGRDPMADLARECRKTGIRLCFYYSQSQDWHDPDAMGNTWDYPDASGKDFNRYLRRKCRPQVKELLTQYGPIGLIWFDTPQRITRRQSLGLKRLVRSLQPDCLVSGRIGNEVGDYGSLGDNEQSFGPIEGNWETPCTLNDTWGFKPHDRNWKSVETLVRLLVNCASRGVNYLLNVGPDARGVIPAASANRLRGVGRWLEANGEAIYGTRRNPFPHDFPWGTVTCRKGAIYLHITAWPRGPVALRGLRTRVKGARLLGHKRVRIDYTQHHRRTADDHEVTVTLPRRKPAGPVPVIALDITGEPDVDQALHQQPDGSIAFSAHRGILKGQQAMAIHCDGSVIRWTSTRGSIRWPFVLHDPGTYRVLVQTAMDRDRKHWFGTHDVRVAVGRRAVRGRAGRKDMILDERVNRWHAGESELGTLTLDAPGEHELVLRVENFAENAPAGFTPCGVRLVRTG